MTNEFRLEMAVNAVNNAWAKGQECKANNDNNGAYMWFEEAYGMTKMFQILTDKKIVIRDNKAVLDEA